MNPVITRCTPDRPCDEVVARLIAADKSKAEGFDEVARRLREAAARYAALHDHGQHPDELDKLDRSA